MLSVPYSIATIHVHTRTNRQISAVVFRAHTLPCLHRLPCTHTQTDGQISVSVVQVTYTAMHAQTDL